MDEMRCDHEFEGGLCFKCLAPESPRYEQRAINAFENYDSIRNTWIDNVWVDKDYAITLAWKLHANK